MKKIVISLFIYASLSISLGFTQETGSPREKLLTNMTTIYNTMLSQPGKDYYTQLDNLLRLEQELYKNTKCVKYFGFINDNRAKEIARKTPDKEKLYKSLLKYQYDTAITVNNALYEIHKALRSIASDTSFIQKLTNRMLDFQIAPRYYGLGDVEAKDSNFYYNQEGIEKLIRIAAKNYTGTEKTAYATWYVKCKNIEQDIYNELARKYILELYQIEPNKKKREKKKLEITPELIKEYYPELYREMTDSLIKVYTSEGIEQLYKKDVSRFIYVLGKIYAKISIPTLEAIDMDTINHSEKERYMARIALARLGVQEYEYLFLKKEQPKAGELIYICSQASAYRFAELMSDTTKTTGCFPWIWEIAGKEYKDMKVSLAFKYLWILNRANFIKEFSVPFDYNYDDYCLFYTSNTYSKDKEKALIENAINWLEKNKGRYELNPYAYDYNLNY